MAPSYSRQLLVISIPTIAVLLSYLWYKRKRIGPQSDPGDNPKEEILVPEKTFLDELEEASRDITPPSTPDRSFSRSLSGIETTPIDIIIPRELRSQKTSPVIISDEDLDFEIEKVKSMKNTVDPYNISKLSDTVDSPLKTPTKRNFEQKELFKNSSPMPKKESVKSKSKNTAKNSPKKMAQKEVAKVENQLNALKLETKDTKKSNNNNINNNNKNEQEELQRQNSERDSANHSPSDVMLASPSLSSISDNHSEGSSDSGKGGSDVATPPSRTPAGDAALSTNMNIPTIYEFFIPGNLVGRLIGRHGNFVTEIKDKTRAYVTIHKHSQKNKLKICSVQGTQLEIDNALRMIRERFPTKRFPDFTLESIPLPEVSNVPLSADHLYLKLVEGINNDTIVSCMVTPNHLFLQQPTHPSYPSLHVLTNCMNSCYDSSDSPELPKPVQVNTVCVAQSVGDWYRAMILSTDESKDVSYVTFLDYGGFAFVENSKLKQIRGDFLMLPFQAAECILANIRPVGGENAVWLDDAYNLVAELTKGAIALTQIADYTEHGIPLVLMYILVGPHEVIFLNEELVKRGYAEYYTYESILVQEESEGAVGGVTA